MSSTGPRRLGKRTVRAASGGVAVMIVLLLLLFLRGGGPGSGDGETEATGEIPADAQVQGAVTSDAPDTTGVELTGLSEDERRALADDVLVVLIDEHDYLIRIADETPTDYRPIELDRLVEVATQATGDTNGIRVRIQKKTTARASAEHTLRLELEQAGIRQDAVFESSELVE